jgi:uncharacterized glyoxalase superfamily protein PhnB
MALKKAKAKTKSPSRAAASLKPKAAKARAKAAPGSGALRMTEVSPSFTANDLEKSIAWYRDVVGFVVGERWEREGKLVGCELRAGSVSLMLAQDDWKKGRDRDKGQGVRLYCGTTQDVDALARQIRERGGKLESEPADQPWGSRDFSLSDPDGFKITIGRETKKR